MGQSRTADLAAPTPRSASVPPERGALALAIVLLLAGIAGLLWVGVMSSDPDTYIRVVSGWLLFP